MANMAPDLRPGPDSPPTDELDGAEAALRVMQQVLHPIAADDMSRPTPCAQFDVTRLTDHLLKSLEALGGMAGADVPDHADSGDSVERRVIAVARPALDAWRQRGLDGTVSFGGGEMPARNACAILALELLVHAWDYARAVGRDVRAPEPLAEYVLGLAHRVIRPEVRGQAGFDDPVEVPADADALTKLVAFTGRNPAR
ncbi:TIGR03086 family protein [Mycobacterium avium subsp. hominissuis]|uniref:TIGR03086 family metal-binding protein n=1 Tax=Mycobacterium avium TaxID=1764 RepID=UPI000A0766E3|nr:TIGR03086 family metal-binding protein [Mycobacterium avium]ATO65645.1 TIGR03086 family protein [Mycobacterium avium subsp. hominissuis]ATO70216.1 TIGR03086 family protein [Mycobacterium avium subsp. hominissuis]PBJ58263.1 TIGR03086 family protein [Mycobacterium avium subsp. hominissuis]PBJ65785.1 TIGR03086 family protein [Mycobacterium avium subsp. hominissuis]